MQQEVCAACHENTLNFRVQTVTALYKHSNKPALNNVQMSELHCNLLFKAALTGSSPPTGHALTWSTNSPAPKRTQNVSWPQCCMTWSPCNNLCLGGRKQHAFLLDPTKACRQKESYLLLGIASPSNALPACLHTLLSLKDNSVIPHIYSTIIIKV